jgi:hypothetical protein
VSDRDDAAQRAIKDALDTRPYRLRMGLRPLDLAEWIVVDERFEAERAEKLRLLEERPGDVVAHGPGTEAAAGEVLDALASHLAARFPDRFARHGRYLDDLGSGGTWDLDRLDRHPIDVAGRLVQEDLCLLTTSGEDPEALRFTAGSVCFPTRWALRDKIGRDMRGVHAPVPRYVDQLAAPVDGTFARLPVDRPVWRLNWSVLDDPALFQPGGHERVDPRPGVDAATAGTTVFLRVERQTLRRFAIHGAVLFTIRVFHRPLDVLSPSDAGRLAAALRALPDVVAAYKSVPAMAGAALPWLDARAAGTAAG